MMLAKKRVEVDRLVSLSHFNHLHKRESKLKCVFLF